MIRGSLKRSGRASAVALLTLATVVCSDIGWKACRAEAQGARRPPPSSASDFLTDVPTIPGSVVLGRPTATSVTLSVVWHTDAEIVPAWGLNPNRLSAAGPPVRLSAGEPRRVVIDGLTPDTRYAYALLEMPAGQRLLPLDGAGSFHTARAPGHGFTFTVQADSHLDGSCSPDLYRVTLANVLAEAPDFHIDLGDTFMTDKHPSRESAAVQYAAQRYYFGMIGHAVPVFLALGNHDGEAPDRNGSIPADGLAAWAHRMRTRFFANPAPDGFYSGNPARHATGGLLENYYAWQWGDALFVVIDPYRTSLPTRGGRSPWNMTIGTEQYDWLVRTLRGSRARHKFVFIHQLTGSDHPAGRGGAEAAAYGEWGGRDPHGSGTFDGYRPGWAMPIHRLLTEAGVSVVFHGHDHFYARQELDGVVYQLVPQPAHRNTRSHTAAEYGYTQGDFLPNSGHLRVSVTPEQATVDYVRSAPAGQAPRGAGNGDVSASYTVRPRGGA